ncbi:MAG: transposase [Coprococcus phoceensis]
MSMPKPNLSDSKTVIKYIGRYLGRPVIATSRIDNYDGDTVTFHYNRHEDNNIYCRNSPGN